MYLYSNTPFQKVFVFEYAFLESICICIWILFFSNLHIFYLNWIYKIELTLWFDMNLDFTPKYWLKTMINNQLVRSFVILCWNMPFLCTVHTQIFFQSIQEKSQLQVFVFEYRLPKCICICIRIQVFKMYLYLYSNTFLKVFFTNNNKVIRITMYYCIC